MHFELYIVDFCFLKYTVQVLPEELKSQMRVWLFSFVPPVQSISKHQVPNILDQHPLFQPKPKSFPLPLVRFPFSILRSPLSCLCLLIYIFRQLNLILQLPPALTHLYFCLYNDHFLPAFVGVFKAFVLAHVSFYFTLEGPAGFPSQGDQAG